MKKSRAWDDPECEPEQYVQIVDHDPDPDGPADLVYHRDSTGKLVLQQPGH